MDTQFTQRLVKIEQALTAHSLNGKAELAPAKNGTRQQKKENTGISLLTKVCSHLISSGGKRWRPLMMVLSYELAGGTSDSIYALTPLIEAIHTASLIHDDIEDNAVLRRGKTAVHIQYGLDTALNAGSWLYFKALSCIEHYAGGQELLLDLYKTSLHTICALHEGQAMDIAWHRDTHFFPTRFDYQQMIRLKTGSLAALAGYSGIRAAEKTDEQARAFAEIAALTGVGFQIADDIKNITKGNKGKKRGDDIVEGKKSLPVILHIEKHPEDAGLLSSYFEQAKKEGIESLAVEKAIQLLYHSGAIAEAEKQGNEVIACALQYVQTHYANHKAAMLLQELVTFMQKE